MEETSEFRVGIFMSFKIKTTEVTRLENMVEYAEAMNKSPTTPDQAALYHEKSKKLLDSYDFSKIDIEEENDVAPLLVASSVGFLTFLEKWKSHGLSFNVVDSKGNTPLHYVAKNPWYLTDLSKTVQFLLQNGVSADYRNNSGKTPLHFMGRFFEEKEDTPGCSAEIIEQLVNAGADMNDDNDLGLTPFVLAFYDDRNDCHRIEDLLNYGADPIVEIKFNRECMLEFFKRISEHFAEEGPPDGTFTARVAKKLACIEKLVRHFVRLEVLGFNVSEHVNSQIEGLLQTIDHVRNVYPAVNDECPISRSGIDDFREECKREKEKLKGLKLDHVNSMYDLARKSVPELWRFTYKDVFQEYFSSKEYRKEFPIYWFILRLQFKAVEERKRILPEALVILKACNLPLYDVCLEHILNQFTNEELGEFIFTNKSILHTSCQVEDDEVEEEEEKVYNQSCQSS